VPENGGMKRASDFKFGGGCEAHRITITLPPKPREESCFLAGAEEDVGEGSCVQRDSHYNSCKLRRRNVGAKNAL